MKAAVSVSPSGVHFGEAYIVWTAIFGCMNITAGKFRQQLGVVNRWHKHALDQYDFPLMLTEPFGPGGLNQIGVAFEFRLPKLTAKTNELVVQVTNGMNDKAFAGQYFSIPTTLVHYKNYWDLSRNTYLELGLTGIAGFNNRRGDHAPASVYTDPAQTQPFVLYDDQGNPLPIPVNAQAKISIPKLGLDGVVVEENGRTLWKKNAYCGGVTGITDGTDDSEYTTFDTGSGTYHFTLRGRQQ